MTDYPYEGEVQLLGFAWNPDDGNWARFRFHSDTEEGGHPFKGLPRGRENGQRFRIRFDLIADDETTTAEPAHPGPEQRSAPAKADTSGWSEAKRKMVQRSGIVRKEVAFQQFLKHFSPLVWNEIASWPSVGNDEEAARNFLHHWCTVDSCSDLEPRAFTGERFTELMAHYDASQHGQGEQQAAQRAAGPGV